MRLRQLTIATLILYASLTAYSVARGFLGQGYIPFFTPLLSLLAFTFALLHAGQSLGWRRALLLLGLTFAVSLLFESVGVATGWVYGAYHYTDRLGPKFLGLVPYLIPVAWFMMTYPSYVIARRLVPERLRTGSWRLALAAGGAVAMTGWDLAMDPMMVAGGHWVWDQPGAYFGVPVQNYWGWWLTIFVTFILFLYLGKMQTDEGFQVEERFLRLAVISYGVTGLSSVLVDWQSGLGGPALVGLFAMLPWVALAWWRS
ncbi:MAG TPA: carotenoid biosynthesis protein [Anaerolineales bacterium]|nr:carotenoid biosynthesis protein [Anaerolineales bacterium]